MDLYALFLPPATLPVDALLVAGVDFGVAFFIAAWFPIVGQLSGTTLGVSSHQIQLRTCHCDIRGGGTAASGVPGAVLGPELDSA